MIAFSVPAAAVDEPAFLPGVKDAADQLQLYLNFAAKTGGRPDFSKPPASALFARVFDLKQLAALPLPQSQDMGWAPQWLATVNGIAKSILYIAASRRR